MLSRVRVGWHSTKLG